MVKIKRSFEVAHFKREVMIIIDCVLSNDQNNKVQDANCLKEILVKHSTNIKIQISLIILYQIK